MILFWQGLTFIWGILLIYSDVSQGFPLHLQEFKQNTIHEDVFGIKLYSVSSKHSF